MDDLPRAPPRHRRSEDKYCLESVGIKPLTIWWVETRGSWSLSYFLADLEPWITHCCDLLRASKTQPFRLLNLSSSLSTPSNIRKMLFKSRPFSAVALLFVLLTSLALISADKSIAAAVPFDE